MRKQTFFDTLLGIRRPKSFSKETQEQIRYHTKVYLLNYGRVKLCGLGDIAKYILKSKSYDFNGVLVWRWLGANYGLKGDLPIFRLLELSNFQKQGKRIFEFTEKIEKE